jgi:hypothetical protein
MKFLYLIVTIMALWMNFGRVSQKNYSSKLHKTVKIKVLQNLIQKSWFPGLFLEGVQYR